MPHILMKPVHWNDQGYRRPGGHRATSGFPKEWGFGHEEWNNAQHLTFRREATVYRAFHTEPAIGPDLSDDNNHVVFMYASHHGKQELVGIAAKATDLTEFPKQRKAIRELIDFDQHLDQVLELLRDGRLPVHDAKEVEKKWRSEEQYLPRWTCPEDYFLWLERPIRLDAQHIRGKNKLLTMFSRYTTLNVDEAIRVMHSVPDELKAPAWYRIHDEIWNSLSDITGDIAAIQSDRSVDSTTREQLVQARCGQGRFRQAVLASWHQRCAVSGCGVSEALRASHIKSWCDSNNRERLDGNNGLALVASIDALFDKALISFSDNGTMLVSPRISNEDRRILGLPAPLKLPLNAKQREYMTAHRTRFEQRAAS
jgi:hypothetical protein